MQCLTFMHQHRPLLHFEMTPFGLPRKHKPERFLRGTFGAHLFKDPSVAKSSGVTLEMQNGIPIEQVTKEAFV
jgi:hypothetical protein